MRARALWIAVVVVTAALLAGAVPAGAETEADWMRALRIRSEGLNQLYGLGVDQAAAPARALQVRGEALNRIYGLDGREGWEELHG
jgi:hypothetical protein